MSLSFVELVLAITLAFILQHVSMLLLLGRREELFTAVDNLTCAMAGDQGTARPVAPTRPAAIPAGHDSWCAPIPINHQACYM